MNAKKYEKIESKVRLNLDYIRLKADVYAVGALIRDTEPTPQPVEENLSFFAKTFSTIKSRIKDKVGQIAKEELLKKEVLAKQALKEFEESHCEKQLKLSAKEDKLKKILSKKLFKNDDGSLARLQYGLTYAIADNHQYQCYEDSLRAVSEILFENPEKLIEVINSFVENYKKLEIKKFENIVADNSEINWKTISSEIKGVFKSFVFSAFKFDGVNNDKESAKINQMSKNSLLTELAIMLTLLEETKKIVSEEEFSLIKFW